MAGSTYFYIGRLSPAAHCFNLCFDTPLRLRLDMDALISRESLAIQVTNWPGDYDPLYSLIRQRVDDLLGAHAYYARGDFALRWEGTQWIETESNVDATTTVGFHDPLGRTNPQDPNHADNRPLADAAILIPLVERVRALHLALRDFRSAVDDTGDDSVFNAYHCIEDIRQHYQSGDGAGARSKAWKTMHDDLGTSKQLLSDLTEAAKPVRHGQVGGLTPLERKRHLDVTLDVIRRFVKARSDEHGLTVTV